MDPPPNHAVAAAVSGRRVSIMETNINEPNTTYSADKVLLDRFNQPIKYEGNPAALAGLAEDIVDALKRQRIFYPLFANRAVAKPDGKMLVTDRDSALFVNGTYDDGETYGYDKPCPPSVKRTGPLSSPSSSLTRRAPHSKPALQPSHPDSSMPMREKRPSCKSTSC